MKKLLWFGLLMVSLAPVPAMAQSAFNGTWKIDLNKAEFSAKPEVLLLQNGMWRCQSCVSPTNIKADGQDHKVVTNDPCEETLSVKVADDRTVEFTSKENGKVTDTEKETVSPDGNTLTYEGTDTCNAKAEPVTFEGESTRVAKGPAGSHAVSGSWRTTKMSGSDNALIRTWKVAGNTVSWSDSTGESFAGKLDGTYAPVKGDPSHTMASVRREGKDTIVQTVKLKGKVTGIARLTVAPDGKTMTIAATDTKRGTTDRLVAEKQ